MEIVLGKGSKIRLKRIQELKNFSEKAAMEYAISVAWLVAERNAKESRINQLIRKVTHGSRQTRSQES